MFRLDRYDGNKIKLLKICLNSPEDVQMKLKNKFTKIPGIQIKNDQARIQQEYFKVRTQFNDLSAEVIIISLLLAKHQDR